MAGISYIWNLPGFRRSGALARTFLSGWIYNGITTLRTGLALDPGLSVKNQGLAVDVYKRQRPQIKWVKVKLRPFPSMGGITRVFQR